MRGAPGGGRRLFGQLLHISVASSVKRAVWHSLGIQKIVQANKDIGRSGFHPGHCVTLN